jgi:hypothetical protein
MHRRHAAVLRYAPLVILTTHAQKHTPSSGKALDTLAHLHLEVKSENPVLQLQPLTNSQPLEKANLRQNQITCQVFPASSVSVTSGSSSAPCDAVTTGTLRCSGLHTPGSV